MSGFLSSLVARHAGAENKVLPRLRGKYEPLPGATPHHDGLAAQAAGSIAPPAPLHENAPHTYQQPPLQPQHAPAANFMRAPSAGMPLQTPAQQQSSLQTGPVREAETAMPSASHTVQHVHQAGNISQTIQHNITNHDISITNLPPGQPTSPVITQQTASSFQPSTLNLQRQPEQHTTEEPTSHLQPATSHLNPDPSWLNELRKAVAGALPAAGPQQTQQPVIKVNIGRIDVRAVAPQQGGAKASPPRTPRAGMSLEEFLKNKNGSAV